jgi:hypothetical protein
VVRVGQLYGVNFKKTARRLLHGTGFWIDNWTFEYEINIKYLITLFAWWNKVSLLRRINYYTKSSITLRLTTRPLSREFEIFPLSLTLRERKIANLLDKIPVARCWWSVHPPRIYGSSTDEAKLNYPEEFLILYMRIRRDQSVLMAGCCDNSVGGEDLQFILVCCSIINFSRRSYWNIVQPRWWHSAQMRSMHRWHSCYMFLLLLLL